MAIGIRSKPRPFGRRGATSTQDYNNFQSEVVADLTEAAAEINALSAEIDRVHLIRYQETAAMRAQLDGLIAEQKTRDLFSAAAGDQITKVIDFRGFSGTDYEVTYAGLAEARRARLEPLYGQVVLPYNYAINRVYSVNTDTGEPVLPGSIEIQVTGYNETGGTVVEGTKKYAVNGFNQDYWIRKVRFPVHSDVDYVEASIQINLPANFTLSANMLSLHPFPLGEVDVREIKYSADASDPSVDLPGFSAVNCAAFRRWHFSDRVITKISVRLRQRHFVEENGFKVFYLGLQECLLHLIDFDKLANPAAGPGAATTYNGLIVKIDAPSGYTFDSISRFWSDPTWATSGSDNKVYWRIYSDAALTSLQWSSWADPAPQDTPVDLSSLGVSSIYALLTLEWDDVNNVSPVVNTFGLRYTVQ